MKKKLFTVLVSTVLALLIVVAACFAGCDIIKVDEYREGQQAVATVKYKDLSLDVTKVELENYCNQYAYYYVSYYGMGVEEAVEYFYKTLTYNKLNVLKAIYAVAQKDGKTVDASKSVADIIKGLLSNAEYDYAIDETNEAFESNFNSYLESVKSEYAALEQTDEEEADEEETETVTLNKLTARTTKTKESESHEFVMPETDIAAEDVSPFYFDSVTAENKYEIEAKRRLINSIKNAGYTDEIVYYDYCLEAQLMSVILTKYQRECIEESDETAVTAAEINAEYAKMRAADLKNIKDAEAYASAIEKGSSGTVLHNWGRYGYVQQILIKFTDEVTGDISAYEKQATNADTVDQYRLTKIAGMTVNVSNYDYDSSATCTGCQLNPAFDNTKTCTGAKVTAYYVKNAADLKDEAEGIEHLCTDENCPLKKYIPYDTENDKKLNNDDNSAVLALIGLNKEDEGFAKANALAIANGHACDDENCPLKAYTELDVPYTEILDRIIEDLSAATTAAEKLEAFDRWIYLVNDDSGIFNNATGYCITPEGADSSYVASFTELGRQLVLKNIGDYALTDDFIAAKIAEGNKDYNDIINYTDEQGRKLTYCVSNYGIHILINGNVACTYDYAGDAATDGTEKDSDGNIWTTLDYVVDVAEGTTLRASIEKTLHDQKVADKKSYDNLNFYADKSAYTINKNKKVYKAILKEYKELLAAYVD